MHCENGALTDQYWYFGRDIPQDFMNGTDGFTSVRNYSRWNRGILQCYDGATITIGSGVKGNTGIGDKQTDGTNNPDFILYWLEVDVKF